MLCCKKILKQTGEYQFKEEDHHLCEELNDTINCLLSGYQSDIRAIVVCTDSVNEVPDQTEFQRQFSGRQGNSAASPQDKGIPTETVVCFRSDPSEYLGEALKAMINYVEGAVGAQYINKDAKTAASIYCDYDDLIEKVPPSTEWSRGLANRASQVLCTDEMKNYTHRVPNICVLLILPESFFETFLRPNCYFPSFIKYVIRAIDGAQALKALQTQVQERDQIIAKQRQFIDKVKNEPPADSQSEFGENTTAQAPPAEDPSEVNAQEKDQAAEPAQEAQNMAMDTTGISDMEHHESEVLG